MLTQLYSFRFRSVLLVLALGMLFPVVGRAQLVVDCTGVTPGASGPGTAIFVVAGPCNESLQLTGWTNLFIGTYYGYPNVAINGSVNVVQSHGVYLHGLNISAGTGGGADGINVSQSQALVIDNCTSSGNAGVGLRLSNGSEALVISPASFDNNNQGGINLYGNSFVEL